MCHAGSVTTSRITFVGPPTSAMGIVTALADAPGVDLVSSDSPRALDPDTVELSVVVQGTSQAVSDAIDSISADLPEGAAIELAR